MNVMLADCLLFQTVRYATNRMCTLQKTSLKYLSAISMYVNGAKVSVYIRPTTPGDVSKNLMPNLFKSRDFYFCGYISK